MQRTVTRGCLAALAVLMAAASTATQGGAAQAAPRAAGQCGGNVADYTYPARPFVFDDVISKWNGLTSIQFNDDMTLTATPNDDGALTSGKWELHNSNGPNAAKVGVVTFYTTVSPNVVGDGVATIYHYVGYPNCNPTTANQAKQLFQIVGDVQLQPVYEDGSYGTPSTINGFQADR